MTFYCMLVLVLVLCLLLDIIVECTAIPICLTWNATDIHLIVKCLVTSAKFDIVIADPHGNVRGHCDLRDPPLCSKRYQIDVLFEDNFGRLTAVTLKTGLYVGGEWTCQHGNETKKSEVSFTEGMIPSIDMMIYGTVATINGSNLFNLVCFSCWVSYETGVDMYVNEEHEDSIRYHGGLCYHKKNLCMQGSCTCSPHENNFTWIYISDLPYINFTCGMRFKDEIKSRKFIRKANLIYNGSVFIPMQTTTIPILESNLDKHPNRIPDDANKEGTEHSGFFGFVVVGIVCAIIITTLVCLWRRYASRQRNTRNANMEPLSDIR